MTSLSAIVLFAAASAVLIYVAWNRCAILRRHDRLRSTPNLIADAMDLHRIAPADAWAAGMEPDLYAAVERCRRCAETETCRACLAESNRKAALAICGNGHFFQEVAAHKAATAQPLARAADAGRASRPGAGARLGKPGPHP